jgi:uncharacterized cupredoxin-like copper-binding protein
MTARCSPARVTLRIALATLVLALAACSGADEATTATTTTTEAAPAPEPSPANAENRVSIDMKEYAYTLTGSLRAGTSTVALGNSGTEYHMAEFNLLRPDKTVEDVRKALMTEDQSVFDTVVAKVLDAPGAFLAPGQSQELTTPLLSAGTYAVVCYIPAPGDGAAHFAKGMVTTLTVAEGEATATPAAGATYTIGDGTVEGPATLPAGRTTLELASSGTGPHEFFAVRRKDPAVTFEALDKAFGDLFESESPPPPGYAETLPGVIVASSFDVPSGTKVFLTVDLQPGSYFLGCAREPGDEEGVEAKEHTGELIELTVT